MAYMTKDRMGPYPNKAGEYCGNHYPNSERNLGGREDNDRYLKTMRFGRPRPCVGQTSEERAAEGWVGLYLKEDIPNLGSDFDIPTPPELMEPPQPGMLF